MHDHAACPPDRAQRLNDPHRLETQISEQELAHLLDLDGHEDVLDLGSGTGFYTDRVAALTSGTVYALDVQPEMHDQYRARGVPTNVKLVLGDITHLALGVAGVDVAYSIAAWHETAGEMDLPGLMEAMRPEGRLVVIDWRRDADSWEDGPPKDIRFTGEEVALSLVPHFASAKAENIGRFMFAVVARRVEG
ncbi:MAG: hypothetical protein A2133_06585 [Actinobacteria bacterium RBG_16_64_13]|nr:MAG: hypothetical protein A2133_06585 [Actinobacteria bacterium RBG_16_64_13]